VAFRYSEVKPEMEGRTSPLLPESVALVGEVGLIEAVKFKLINQRVPGADRAAGQLAAALAELNQIFGVAEWALDQYSSVYLYDGQDPHERHQERTKLLQLRSGTIQREGSTNQEGGTIYTQMKNARTHCQKIWNIYDRFLKFWFASVLDARENALMGNMFVRFGSADDVFSDEIKDLADWLSQQARETVVLLDKGKLQEANQLILAASADTLPQRAAIGKARDKLSDLRAEFTQAAAVVE
jgi:hypothetical protein